MSSGAHRIDEFASAKLNLSLKVLGRRADNYHELESLVVFVNCGDRLTATSGTNISLNVTGRYAEFVGEEKDNLVFRAADALSKKLGVKSGALIALEKNLPVASGIGGGSADAAACLRALSQLWDAEISRADLDKLALTLGADVPVCLEQKSVIMRGIGERITPLSALPRFYLLLVNSGIAVSTAAVFKALAAPPLTGEVASSVPATGSLDELLAWLGDNPNDLEAPAIRIAPEIKTVLELIGSQQGCRLARMSGSGATCFGIFADEKHARAATDALRQSNQDWWIEVSTCG